MWADASGYYVYLPSTFIYHWDSEKLPSGIDTLTGRGFSVDTSKDLIFTKYTSGISYLQLPFFAAAHLYAKISGEEANGFSQVYVNSLLFSGVFYVLLALFCLYYFLLDYFGKGPSLITCIAILACTNLYYYGIEHPGLSHVYSFFLICMSMLLIQKNSKHSLLIIVPASMLLILIRPTNVIAVLTLLFIHFDLNAYTIRQFLKVKNLYIGLLIGSVFLIPQLLYWHSVSGNWLMYSYQNEGFIFWNRPYIAEVLLAACNGFLPYAPVFMLAFIGLIWKPLTRYNTWIVLTSFALITYLNASWWCWPFGCAYGGRAFIEYYPFLAIGLSSFINQMHERGKISRYGIAFLLFTLAFLNLKLLYNYDDCFYGDTWDYHVIRDLLF